MSMRVVVSDSSVLIDLERGTLFEAAFSLPLVFCVPDILYRRELEPYGGQQLIEQGLRILELDADGAALAERYYRSVSDISVPDAFSLALARATTGTLLTGDARLRQLAHDEDVACHGVLWLIDQMFETPTATADVLHAALSRIRDHPRCRLPAAEINKRLRAFDRATSHS